MHIEYIVRINFTLPLTLNTSYGQYTNRSHQSIPASAIEARGYRKEVAPDNVVSSIVDVGTHQRS